MRTSVRAGLGAAGVVATALGVLAIVAPTLVTGTPPLSTVADAVADVGVRTLILVGCVAVGLYLLRAAGRSLGGRTLSGDGPAADRFERLRDAPPERVTASEERRTAGAFDANVERAVAGDGWALEAVRERLSRAVVASLDARGVAARGSAERAVASGAWTGDPVAAAFLSGPGGRSFSLSARIRLWLDPGTERRRRIERTVRTIEATEANGPPGGLAGVRDGTAAGSGAGDRATADRRGAERRAAERGTGSPSDESSSGRRDGRPPTGAVDRPVTDGDGGPAPGASGGPSVRGDGGGSEPADSDGRQSPQSDADGERSRSADPAREGSERAGPGTGRRRER